MTKVLHGDEEPKKQKGKSKKSLLQDVTHDITAIGIMKDEDIARERRRWKQIVRTIEAKKYL